MKKENLFTPDCIRTYTGQYVNVTNLDPSALLIEDIAHSLANQYRFGGHLPVKYTVAQHCVMASGLTKGDKFEALMHDATEAYILDIPSPIKKYLPDYQQLEHNLATALAEKFGFNYPFSQETKDVDLLMLKLEGNDCMLRKSTHPIKIWSSDHAEQEFLEVFDGLSPIAYGQNIVYRDHWNIIHTIKL